MSFSSLMIQRFSSLLLDMCGMKLPPPSRDKILVPCWFVCLYLNPYRSISYSGIGSKIGFQFDFKKSFSQNYLSFDLQ